MIEYNVNLEWDKESAVWIATSKDIKGLVLESDSIDALIERIKFALPELLELNNNKIDKDISICFKSERHEQLYI